MIGEGGRIFYFNINYDFSYYSKSKFTKDGWVYKVRNLEND